MGLQGAANQKLYQAYLDKINQPSQQEDGLALGDPKKLYETYLDNKPSNAGNQILLIRKLNDNLKTFGTSLKKPENKKGWIKLISSLGDSHAWKLKNQAEEEDTLAFIKNIKSNNKKLLNEVNEKLRRKALQPLEEIFWYNDDEDINDDEFETPYDSKPINIQKTQTLNASREAPKLQDQGEKWQKLFNNNLLFNNVNAKELNNKEETAFANIKQAIKEFIDSIQHSKEKNETENSVKMLVEKLNNAVKDLHDSITAHLQGFRLKRRSTRYLNIKNLAKPLKDDFIKDVTTYVQEAVTDQNIKQEFLTKLKTLSNNIQTNILNHVDNYLSQKKK